VLSESLKAYDLLPNVHRSVPSVRRETTAREQLALDLALSNRLYTSHSFFNPGLEAMAGSLTIHENSEVKFGFLSPMRRLEQQIGEPEEKGICPEGVTLLLKGWEVGTDPRRFAYHEPTIGQEIGGQTMTSAPKAASPLPVPVMPRFLTPEPVVITTKKVQHLTQADDAVSTQRSSQDELMANTQILPGPYGGRPVKKKAKKRMGGF
jgi:hypothetical protein